MAILYFSDILKKVGLDPKKVKLIRHAYSHKNFKKLAERNMIYEYTRHQRKDFSKGYDYWVVFISGKGTLAQLYTVYKAGNYVPDTPDMIPEGSTEEEAGKYTGDGAIYELTRLDILKEYEGKLTIDWGPSTRKWDQKGTTEKPVISIMPDQKKVFMGYDEVLLSYDQLKEIVDNKEIYEAWHIALKSVNAIYLIVDTETGKQYVGSAYGEDGLFGRWCCYVNSHHGNNKKMKELICNYPERYHAFQFSILQILPKTIITEDVVKIENKWKARLLSKKFGMNDN
ncbi:GIY-YIG nuclease family protein [Ruminococcus sp.]|uniref:GIY-YIG nuclease family protein n=1 Tax=Ruminococcus sp. TaxID=41978 RepID=UPI00258DB61D|nr:GIY-YIG nuclease family protein [Ruminococcus sp.]MCR5020857.1 GIY-YIG nuclease family protein [Ruminococcus sp.]